MRRLHGPHRPHGSRCPLVLVLVLVLVLATGCATVRTGRYGSPVDARGHVLSSETTPLGLKVSSQEVRERSSAYFGLVAITFENVTDHWVRFRSMRVRFLTEDQNRAVLIPWGRDLATWQRAAGEREEVRRANTQLVLAGVALGGALAAGAAPTDELELLGGAVAAGSVTALAVEEVDHAVGAPKRPGPFPETHVMAVPFGVPPGLFTRRWLLLNTPGSAEIDCVTSLVLEYETERGERERIWLPFRTTANRSEWQAWTCERAAVRDQGRAKR